MEGFCCSLRVEKGIIDVHAPSPCGLQRCPGLCKVADGSHMASLVFSLIVNLSAALVRITGWIYIRIYSVLYRFSTVLLVFLILFLRDSV